VAELAVKEYGLDYIDDSRYRSVVEQTVQARTKVRKIRKPSLSNSSGVPILDWIQALADECRLGIVLLLWRKGEVCVTEIVKAFEVGQPTVSHHLRVLRRAGIISCRKDGLWCYYTLNRGPMESLSQWFRRLSQMDAKKEVKNGI